MAYITLNTKKLKDNFEYLDNIFKSHEIQWCVVSKLLCGHDEYLTELLKLDIKQVCDSRISNLRAVKKVRPEVETIFIKPPSKGTIKGVLEYADISVNTHIKTIKLLSKEAKKQNKIHKVIIMIELGELREGIMGEDLMDFYKQVFQLENIEVVGIGTNFSCLYGILPNQDKLIQLCLYEQLIEAKFDKQIPYVSGGSSVVIPLINLGQLPKGINHFRVGETLFFGTDLYRDSIVEEMHQDVFKVYSEIIELKEKPIVPNGELGTNVEGKSFEFDDEQIGETSYRAIMDMGLLDVSQMHIKPKDKKISFVGASSDMLVIDLGDNKKGYKVGDKLEFELDYMGILRIMNSKYIDKRIE